MDNYFKKVWSKQPNRVYIMFINFLIGVAPGILYITRNVFIHDEIKMKRSSFDDDMYWIYLSMFLVSFIYTFTQIVMNQIMTISLVRSYFVGQLLSLAFIFMSTSNKVINFMKVIIDQRLDDTNMISSLKKIFLICILVLVTSFAFYIYQYSKFSEIYVS